MKKAFGWIAGLVGIAALARWLARRSAARAEQQEPLAADADPADALRRRLDESRSAAGPEVSADDEPSGKTLEERRARIHVQAQEAIDAMRESGL
jgi:hypothetical protein